jgi:hypothetical protein
MFDLMQKIHVAANIRLRFSHNWRIFASKFSIRCEHLQNFQQISHSSEYSLANICIPANIRFVLLQIIYESYIKF